MANMNVYEKLYSDMKHKFTVVGEDTECTLGECMLAKAREGQSKSNLAVALYTKDNAVRAVMSYINDKLTVKAPPQKDKTIKAFPLRTSFAAMISAIVTCGLLVSYGSALTNIADTPSYVIENEVEEEAYTEAAEMTNK